MLKLSKYYKPFSAYIALIMVFMFGQAVTELFLPTLMSDVVNKGMVAGDTELILTFAFPMLMVALLSMVCAVCGSYFSSLVSAGIGRDLRSAVFTKVESFSLSEYGKFGSASLITRATNDVLQIQQSLIMIFRFMIFSPLMCIGGFVMATSMDRGLTAIFTVSVPVIIILIATVGKMSIPLFRAMQKKLDSLNRVSMEGLTGVRVIRSFNRQEYERERFNAASADLMETSIKVNRILAMLMPAIMLIMNLTVISVIWFGGIRIDAGKTNVGEVMAFLQYAMMIMFSFVMISMLFIMLPRASASAERINEVLESENTIKDPEEPISYSAAKGLVEFKNVSFIYENAQRPVLNNVSFTAAPGQTTAIIGGTGSGKTTLVSLIPRFYDVTGGSVLVDGTDVRSVSQKELRSIIGFVPQKAVLFSDTVSGNIRYGKEDATEAEVAKAAEISQADGFISRLEGGYDYMISQGGTNISGGQRQRLSIARALVRKPLIYVFDDSFSALDMKTDANLRKALKEETVGRTVLIVAQRISSIINADKIIVLDGGEIVGSGKHEELMESCEIYREIAESQR